MTERKADEFEPVGTMAERIRQEALGLGFQAVGFARADEPLTVDHQRYVEFLAQGRHGRMSYLAAHPEIRKRVDGPAIVAGARTVVCLACRYDPPDEAETDETSLTQYIARYARGRDYHGFLRKRLRRLASWVEHLGDPIQARAFCDTAPVLEQAWAVRAGLGFVGKNGLLIVPGQGSWCLLGEVITTLSLDAEAYGDPMAERCGRCTACLDACPTRAFAAPFVLDPRRCVAYATIESGQVPPPEQRAAMGENLFGCDDCQQVCPHNAGPAPPSGATAPFRPLDRWASLSLIDLVRLDDAAWAEISQGSPLKRAGRAGLARNALLVAANQMRNGDERARQVLEIGMEHDVSEVADLARQELAAAREMGPLS